MRHFLLRLLCFALPVAMLIATGEAYVRRLPNPARDKHAWMQRHSPEVETLVLGSSHTFYGIDPSRLGEHAYSLAMVSQTYRYDYYLLTHYPMPRLRTLILPFSYFSLYEDFETVSDAFYAARYRIYMDCDIHSRLSAYNLECAWWSSFREKLRSLYEPQRLTWDERGFGTNYTLSSRPTDWDNGAERAAHNTYADTSAVALNTHYLCAIRDFCRQRGIRFVLTTPPTYATFRAHQAAEQRARNAAVIDSLCLPLLDYEADPRFGDEDFYDADHLNTFGARRYTDILYHDIQHQ